MVFNLQEDKHHLVSAIIFDEMIKDENYTEKKK